jgi:hypothetical protein
VIVLVVLVMLVLFADSSRVELQVLRFSEIAHGLTHWSDREFGTATSLSVRAGGVSAGLSAFGDSPVFGNGIGQSERAYHSGIVTLLAEQGIIGAIFYFMPVIIAGVWLVRIISSSTRQSEAVLAELLVVLLLADYANGMVTHHAFHLQRWLLLSLVWGWLHTTEFSPMRVLPARVRPVARRRATVSGSP